MSANGATMKFYDDHLAGFQNTIFEGVAGGERIIIRSAVSSLGMFENLVTLEAFRESKVLFLILMMIRSPLQPHKSYYFGGNCKKKPHRTHYNTLDSLNAPMVVGFTDIEAFRESKVLLGSG